MQDDLLEADRERAKAKVRADLLNRAQAQGIKPIASIEELAGDPEITADLDVDEFLRQVREDRERGLRKGR
jgi:hypothetical protein